MSSGGLFKIQVEGIEEGAFIPERFAYCVADGQGGTRRGGNVSPALHWSGAPSETQSYAVIVVDPDVPADFTHANKPGQIISVDFPRRLFTHWILVDIPASVTALPRGTQGEGGVNGRNDYGVRNVGYDGPCPPWNDARLHHYHFIVIALDVPSLGLKEGLTREEAEEAMADHVLARATRIGTYSTNPKLLSSH